jgi:methyltransferase (TIGR00027 family)
MPPTDRLLTLVLSLGLGVQLGRCLRRWLSTRRGNTDDPVSASGRLIAGVRDSSRCTRQACRSSAGPLGAHPSAPTLPPAPAWRALESLEQQPLFVDPFAAVLAGAEAVLEALQLAQPFPASDTTPSATGAAGSSAPASPQQARRRFRYSNVAARVWWFDQQLASALGSPASNPACHPRQVVVLGAGYDSRPWRLPLPSGVRWYELDLPGVVEAKRKLLDQLGAGLAPGQPCAHPLRAAAWAALPADLGRRGWSRALLQAGLDPGQPTVWVAEGLLMYLDPEQAAALLAEAAGEGAVGGGQASARRCPRIRPVMQETPALRSLSLSSSRGPVRASSPRGSHACKPPTL